jgi:hypothetical protein
MHASVQRLQRWLDHLTGPDEGPESSLDAGASTGGKAIAPNELDDCPGATTTLPIGTYGEIARCVEWVEKKPDVWDRGIEISLYRSRDDALVLDLTYRTTWPHECDYTRIRRFDANLATLGAVASWVRYAAQDVLPPGAGYSAMPDRIDLQNQLRGQMKYLALRCLSKVLREAFPATNEIHDSR